MKKTLMLCLVMALFPLCLAAQQKIAIVNSDEIMAAMPETKAAQARLQELDKRYSEELQKMQEQYAQKTEAFISESEKLDATIRKSRQQELVDLQSRIQQSANVMQEDFQKQQTSLYTPIQQKIFDAIKAVSDKEGITYVVNSMMMLYKGKDAIDITPLVKKHLGL
ncbi:outer membrane protein [Bacteroidales bacterium KA00251]|nr:outer membrane protein [Bacteroidales bacterium KA00251]